MTRKLDLDELADDLAGELDEQLHDEDNLLADQYPGDRGVRQPVHTVYVPGDRFQSATVAEWGREAVAALDAHVTSPGDLADIIGLAPDLAAQVLGRMQSKLGSEPIEDLRVDFEDGYGNRSDAEEDHDVVRAAQTLARTLRDGQAPPFHGIRFKSFEQPTRRRGLRTLALFVGELAAAGRITDGFVVTLPKVTSIGQVEAMVNTCERLEAAYDLPSRSLRFEIQVETPQSILGSDGTVLVARMLHRADHRCSGLHYGTYDYSASCGISAGYQSMEHPAADHAKAVMQVAAAGTGVHLSDGSTNVLPVGEPAAVRAAWRLHSRLVRRSLERGFYQSWDLHPAQLPTRFAATYAFYREGLPTAAARLSAYLGRRDAGYLDEPATAVALAGFLLRGVECGAIDPDELDALVGADLTRLATLARRRSPEGAARQRGARAHRSVAESWPR